MKKKKYIFGYGSLINLSSASRTLKRDLLKEDILICNLHNYQRSWTIWDFAFSEELSQQIKSVFLNITFLKNSYLNGIIFEISDNELSNFKIREKNYDCVDVTHLIECESLKIDSNIRIYTFVGKKDFLTEPQSNGYYVFQKYIEIVENGICSLDETFINEFRNTTISTSIPIIKGYYSFIDNKQQNAR